MKLSTYNRTNRIPNWVSWSIEKEELAKVVSRSGINFMTDPAAGGTPVSTMDYSRSGYDRGHMCPAADNRFSQTAMEESFYLTYVCPQNHTPNEAIQDASRSYAVSVDEVEHLTGHDFFSDLEKSVQKEVEASYDLNQWR